MRGWGLLRRGGRFPAQRWASTMVFDRSMKARQKALAAAATGADEFDYLRDAIAERVVERVEDVSRNFERGLDLGCGRGHVFLASRKLLHPDKVKNLVQADVAEPIVHAARERCRTEGFPGEEFKVMDEEDIRFEQDTFNLVVSSLSLHWVNDLPGSMVQINNVLKPDGLFVGAMFGGDTLSELRIALQLAEEDIWGGISPHVSPFARLRDVGSVLGRGGFVLTTVDTDEVRVEFQDIFSLMRHLKGMGETSALLNRRSYFGKKAFERAGEIYKERFGTDDGGIYATFQIIFMLGWKYAESQAKPMARGSATHSLGDLEKLSQTVTPNGPEKKS